MPRTNLCRLAVTILLALTALAFFPLQGCKSGPFADMMNRSAMDMLTPMVRDAANSYISNLTSLTSSLSNLKDLQGVIDFAQKAKPMVDQLSSDYKTLSATSGEERSNLMNAFGSQFTSANTGFLSQSDRVRGSGVWSPVVSPVLDKISLFK